MEIHSGKELLEKDENDVPALLGIITQKEQEIQSLLAQENTEKPFELRGNAYKIFQKTRKEILATLHILDQVGHKGKEGRMRKMFKDGSFVSFDNTVDYASPKVQREIKQVVKQQEEVLKSMEINEEELKKVIFTI
jgi:hypothetical protein